MAPVIAVAVTFSLFYLILFGMTPVIAVVLAVFCFLNGACDSTGGCSNFYFYLFLKWRL
jgi:hypothetical protein